ncbi:uncharacterized protein FMAN_01902 [Fusarium mangiferae]|uniref:Uncharacterized protein n=1 Tax=Fusarium mangiferae TaxID=192010 RepID=A0A1L7SH39_FUSMA|nr:uncharacterized protein FMAN_01902 [Fusarium mangiferae]CVK84980.1 uncharacterized protein FMAN_01902 [Fusarium mangiferae]
MSETNCHKWKFVIYRVAHVDEDIWNPYLPREDVREMLQRYCRDGLLMQNAQFTIIYPVAEGGSNTNDFVETLPSHIEGKKKRRASGFGGIPPLVDVVIDDDLSSDSHASTEYVS